MKRLYKMVILSFLGPFMMTFCIVLFILLIQFLWKYIDELVGKGLQLSIISEIMLYASSSLVPLALPLAVLLSSLMTFGNMGEFYELTAIKSSGISLRRIMMPVIAIVILISVGAFFFANNVLPVTNLKMRSLLWDVRQQRPEIQITEGVFYNGIDNYSIRVGKKDQLKNMLYDIRIYDHTERRGNVKVTVADSGQMKMTADKRNLIITLWNGYAYTERNEDRKRKNRYYPHELDKFREQRSVIQMQGFELLRSDENIFRNSYQMLNINQLQRATDSIKRNIDKSSREFLRTFTNYSFVTSGSFMSRSLINSDPGINYNPLINRPGGMSSGRNMVRMTDNRIQKDSLTLKKVISDSAADPAYTVDSLPVTSYYPTQNVLPVQNFDSLINSLSKTELMGVLGLASSNLAMIQYNLDNAETTIESDVKYLKRHEIEWHRKFTLSVACLIFLFIGAPLGAIIRKGGLGMPTVISTLLFILYYIISMTGEKFVREDVLGSFEGMWISSFILIVSGIFLTYQATNDSAILNLDTYITWIRERTGLRKSLLLENKSHITGKFELLDLPKEKLQSGFVELTRNARSCIKSINTDIKWGKVARIAYHNSNLMYLVEFCIHYNSMMDEIILSKWYRDDYFQKRIGEFPYMHGRINSFIFNKKAVHWLAVLLFPVGLIRIIHVRILLSRIKYQLNQIISLSSGMVNLLNSSVSRIEQS